MYSSRFLNQYQNAFSANWGTFFLWGLLLVVLGILAISAATMSTMISIIFLGSLLLMGGVVVVIDAFTFWWKKWSGFFLILLLGVLYIIVGGMLIKSPLVASISLTLFLGIFYLIIGIFRVIYSFSLRVPSWGWGFFSGVISAILGLLILSSWPQSGLYIIGLFVGIDLLFVGWSYIMTSLAARALAK
jgi:uncharacterized membrane protein HdeD (DUF308 family)